MLSLIFEELGDPHIGRLQLRQGPNVIIRTPHKYIVLTSFPYTSVNQDCIKGV